MLPPITTNPYPAVIKRQTPVRRVEPVHHSMSTNDYLKRKIKKEQITKRTFSKGSVDIRLQAYMKD